MEDSSEWRDVDFTFTRDHPDWAADTIVKQYFKDAQARKAVPVFRMEDSTVDDEERYSAIINNETKKKQL